MYKEEAVLFISCAFNVDTDKVFNGKMPQR